MICNSKMQFDVVNNPHPHPLIFQRQGKLDGQEAFCSKCGEPWQPPAFSCSNSDCNFILHQSCIDYPPQIHTPFHSHLDQRPLSISDSEIPCHCATRNPLANFTSAENAIFWSTCNAPLSTQKSVVYNWQAARDNSFDISPIPIHWPFTNINRGTDT